MALMTPLPSVAGQSWHDVSQQTAQRTIDAAPIATTGVELRAFPVPAGVSRAAATPSFFANFVASGIATGGVPCFSCVSGVPSALGIPDPFNYVPSSTTMQYNVAWTNLTFKGTCTVYISITSGTKVVDSASFKVPGITSEGGYDIGVNRPRPTYSGAALITGKVKCGAKSSSVESNLIFQ
jgi:hypothetical protein